MSKNARLGLLQKVRRYSPSCRQIFPVYVRSEASLAPTGNPSSFPKRKAYIPQGDSPNRVRHRRMPGLGIFHETFIFISNPVRIRKGSKVGSRVLNHRESPSLAARRAASGFASRKTSRKQIPAKNSFFFKPLPLFLLVYGVQGMIIHKFRR